MITISLAAFDVITALPFLHGLREADLGSEARLWRTSRQEPNIDAVRDRNPGPTSYPSFEFLDLTGSTPRMKGSRARPPRKPAVRKETHLSYPVLGRLRR